MKCIECNNWDKKNKVCLTSDADPDMSEDQDIFCGEAGDIQEDYLDQTPH